ncbi:MAG: hypothetical protein U9N59_12355 [Campylobacterota bacterium]|nr:hypothetical protein [Campylobacterota bacterium]
MTTKTKLVEDIFLYLSQHEPIPLEIKESDEYKKGLTEIIQDFPLILKGDAGYKNPILRDDFNNNDLVAKLEICKKDKTLYSEKMINPYGKAKYPLTKALKKQKNYICSSVLNNEDIYDFSGNAANMQYYKTITKLLVNNGSYLSSEYKDIELPTPVAERIKAFEKWFDSTQFKVEGHIDNYTTQVLFPLNDSYISISPAQSFGLIKKIIAKNREFSEENSSSRKELNKQRKSEFSKMTKLKKKSKSKENDDLIKQLSLDIKLIDEKLNSIPSIKTTTWQQMVGKIQNFGLLAPSSKKGIFLADAPNYDLEVSQELFAQYDTANFISKSLKNLYYKNEIFKDKADKLLDILLEFSDKEKTINREMKDVQFNSFATVFKFYYNQPSVKKDLDINMDLEDTEGIVSTFLINFLELKKDTKVVLHYNTTKKFYDFILQSVKEQKNEI